MAKWKCPICGGLVMRLSEEDERLACMTDICNFTLELFDKPTNGFCSRHNLSFEKNCPQCEAEADYDDQCSAADAEAEAHAEEMAQAEEDAAQGRADADADVEAAHYNGCGEHQ